MIFSQNKIRKAFKKVAKDFMSIKRSLNEWVIFLDGNQKQMKQRIFELEAKVAQLEVAKLDDLREF